MELHEEELIFYKLNLELGGMTQIKRISHRQ